MPTKGLKDHVAAAPPRIGYNQRIRYNQRLRYNPPIPMIWTLVLRLSLAAAGVILSARALFGPFDFPVPVHSPINAEGWFAIAAALLVMVRLRSDPQGPPPQPTPAPEPRRFAAYALAGVALLIAFAFAGSVHDYFLADDFILLRYAHDFVFNLHGVFATGGGDGFFRPITNMLFGLTYAWAGARPLPWHLEGLVLHALNCALLFTLLRQTGSARASAWFAAALFAIHGTRPEAVVWTGGRFDLLAAFFALLSLDLYLRFDALAPGTARATRALYWTASLLAMALGILSKESAYAAPPILALILFARESRHQTPRDSRPLRLQWRERCRAIAPPLAPLFAVAAALFAYRWILFGGIGGYLDPSGRPQALLLTPVSVVKTLGFRIWAVLAFPLNWGAVSGPGLNRVVIGLAMAIYVCALAWLTTARAQRRALIAPLGFVLLASIPPLQQLLIGPGMDKARYLYLPAAGFCWLLAALASGLTPATRPAVYATLLLFNLAALENNLGAWRQVSRMSRPACIAAAECVREHSGQGDPRGESRLLAIGLPHWIDGAYLFPLGFPDCTRMELDAPAAASLEIAQRDAPPPPEEAAGYACVLAWDPATERLRAIR